MKEEAAQFCLLRVNRVLLEESHGSNCQIFCDAPVWTSWLYYLCKQSRLVSVPTCTDAIMSTFLLTLGFSMMISFGSMCFGDRFHASRKGGIGGGGWMWFSRWPHMVAVVLCCRKAGGPFHSSYVQMSLENSPLASKGLHFWHCSQLIHSLAGCVFVGHEPWLLKAR